MRVLILTKIFPNAIEPWSSPFNRQQFAALAGLCDVEVLATIPWFPGARAVRSRSAAGRLTHVPASEIIDGLPVAHPRFMFIPRLGHALTGPLYAASVLPELLRRRGRFDVILGSWAYPDGFAAVALGRLLGVPAVIKLHGSDLNVVARMRGPRLGLRWALARARRVVAVSRALGEAATGLGAPAERIDIVPNGVDRDRFFPRERAAARAALGLPPRGAGIIYVGRLELPKGIGDLLLAFRRVAAQRSDAELLLVGDGSARAACDQAAAQLGGRVVVAGERPHGEIPTWLAAAEVAVLASWNEGTPNAVLEALACGRRVVASRVGGIPEVVTSAVLGELVPARAPDRLADALLRALATDYDPRAVAAAGPHIAWTRSAELLYASLVRALGVPAAQAA